MTLLKPTVDQELEAISTIINRMHEGLPELRKEAKAGDPKHTAQLLAVLHQGITGAVWTYDLISGKRREYHDDGS
jgi:hypothetical protein